MIPDCRRELARLHTLRWPYPACRALFPEQLTVNVVSERPSLPKKAKTYLPSVAGVDSAKLARLCRLSEPTFIGDSLPEYFPLSRSRQNHFEGVASDRTHCVRMNEVCAVGKFCASLGSPSRNRFSVSAVVRRFSCPNNRRRMTLDPRLVSSI